MKTIRSKRDKLGTCDTRGIALSLPNVPRARRSGFRPNGRARAHQDLSPRSKPTILVAVDFGPQSLKAVEQAFVWAKQWRASILLLHVLEPLYTCGFVNRVTRQKVRREAQHRSLERINQLAASHASEEVPVERVVRDGLPEIEILQLAEEKNVNLIMLGRRPKNLLSRWIMGGVSNAIADIAPCPVMVISGLASIQNS